MSTLGPQPALPAASPKETRATGSSDDNGCDDENGGCDDDENDDGNDGDHDDKTTQTVVTTMAAATKSATTSMTTTTTTVDYSLHVQEKLAALLAGRQLLYRGTWEEAIFTWGEAIL